MFWSIIKKLILGNMADTSETTTLLFGEKMTSRVMPAKCLEMRTEATASIETVVAAACPEIENRDQLRNLTLTPSLAPLEGKYPYQSETYIPVYESTFWLFQGALS